MCTKKICFHKYDELKVCSHLANIFEKSNSHIASILIFTPEWSAGYSLFSQVTECVMNYLWMQNLKKYLKVNEIFF